MTHHDLSRCCTLSRISSGVRRLGNLIPAVMAEFMPTPYRGVPGVPHAPEVLFQNCFLGAQLAMTALLLPGRVFGSELRPYRQRRDYIVAVCDEAARTREAQRGKRPRTFVMKPKEGEQNWHIKWWKQLHRRRWTRGRMGGGCLKQV